MDRTKIIRIVAIIIMMAWTVYANAQTPPHPNGGVIPGSGNTVVGGQQGGAPIGSGNILLIGLALLYATKKAVSLRRQAEA